MSERPVDAPKTGPEEETLDERIAGVLSLALAPGIAVAAAIAGAVQGPPMAVLVLAGGALIGTVAMFWSSVRALFGETRLSGADAFAIGAPSSEEEQKRAVLRALKDIEFEHGVGKISDHDYRVLSARYRAEAKRLLRVLDSRSQPAREEAEKMAKEHLLERGLINGEEQPWDAIVAEGSAASETTIGKPGKKKRKRNADAPAKKSTSENPYVADEDEDEEDEPIEADAHDDADEHDDDVADDEDEDLADDDEDDDDEPVGRSCDACDTLNDGDAVFCKKCGHRFEQPDAAEESE